MSFVQSVSFRARKLDESKPLMVVHDEAVLEAEGTPVVNRSVPDMPTGMEKEEEREAHFVRALQNGSVISIPHIEIVKPVALPNEAPWKQPSHFVVYDPPADRKVMDENNIQAEYDLTESDSEFVGVFILDSQNAAAAAATKKRSSVIPTASNNNNNNNSSTSISSDELKKRKKTVEGTAEYTALCDLAEALIDKYERTGYQLQKTSKIELTKDGAVRAANALLMSYFKQHPQLFNNDRLQTFAKATFDYWMAKRKAKPRDGDFLQDKYKRIPPPNDPNPYVAFRSRGDELTGGSVVGSHARKRRRNTNSANNQASAESARPSTADAAASRRTEAEKERLNKLQKLHKELTSVKEMLAYVIQREWKKFELVELCSDHPEVLHEQKMTVEEEADVTVMEDGAPAVAQQPESTVESLQSAASLMLSEAICESQQQRAQELLGQMTSMPHNFDEEDEDKEEYEDEEAQSEWQHVMFGTERDGDGSSSDDGDAFSYDFVNDDRRQRSLLLPVAQYSNFSSSHTTAPGSSVPSLSLTQKPVPMTWNEWVSLGHSYFGRQDCVYDCSKYSFGLTSHTRNCVPLTETVLSCSNPSIYSPDIGSDGDDESEVDSADTRMIVSRIPAKRPRRGGCLRVRLGRGGRVAFDRSSLEEWLHNKEDSKQDPTSMIDSPITEKKED